MKNMSQFILPSFNKLRYLPIRLFRLNVRQIHGYLRSAGNREQVGYGSNGNPEYFDSVAYPFPAIRWKEPTPELCCLWEKEKGDWRKLSEEEKKELYRASFRQTFAEFLAPSPEWKFHIAGALYLISLGMWVFYLTCLLQPPLPESFSEEGRQFQLRRILDLQVNPIFGLSSKWDYEKDKWK